MKSAQRIAPAQLRRVSTLAPLPFKTTDDLEPAHGIDVQKRAIEALDFGLSIQREGYNLFVMGPEGTGKLTAVRKLLESRAQKEPLPSDWVYVFNYDVPYAPRALRLEPGHGRRL